MEEDNQGQVEVLWPGNNSGLHYPSELQPAPWYVQQRVLWSETWSRVLGWG